MFHGWSLTAGAINHAGDFAQETALSFSISLSLSLMPVQNLGPRLLEHVPRPGHPRRRLLILVSVEI